jgi:two-component system, cell cycle sensor histidine kinase and response regulator CckA
LITDIVMPGMNGPALAEHLCHMHPGLKVLFLSGYAEAAISGRGLLPSDANFLQKPFAPRVLAKTIRAIIDENNRQSRHG